MLQSEFLTYYTLQIYQMTHFAAMTFVVFFLFFLIQSCLLERKNPEPECAMCDEALNDLPFLMF